MTINQTFADNWATKWEPTAYKKKHPRKDNWDKLVYVDRNVDPAVQTVGTIIIDEVGSTGWAAGGLNPNIKLVDVNARAVSVGIQRGETGYGMTLNELEAADLAMKRGVKVFNTNQAKIDAVFTAYHKAMKSLVTMGSESLGVVGLYNNPNFESEGLDKPLADMTGQEAYDAIADLRGRILKQSKKTRVANMLTLTLDDALLLERKRFETHPMLSVLQAIQSPKAVIEGLTPIGLTIAAEDDMPAGEMLFQDFGEDVARIIVPHGIRFLPSQPVGTGFVRHAHFKTSAVQVKDNNGFFKVTGTAG